MANTIIVPTEQVRRPRSRSVGEIIRDDNFSRFDVRENVFHPSENWHEHLADNIEAREADELARLRHAQQMHRENVGRGLNLARASRPADNRNTEYGESLRRVGAFPPPTTAAPVATAASSSVGARTPLSERPNYPLTSSGLPFERLEGQSQADYEDDLRRYNRLKRAEERVMTQRRFAGIRHDMLPDIENRMSAITSKYNRTPLAEKEPDWREAYNYARLAAEQERWNADREARAARQHGRRGQGQGQGQARNERETPNTRDRKIEQDISETRSQIASLSARRHEIQTRLRSDVDNKISDEEYSRLQTEQEGLLNSIQRLQRALNRYQAEQVLGTFMNEGWAQYFAGDDDTAFNNVYFGRAGDPIISRAGELNINDPRVRDIMRRVYLRDPNVHGTDFFAAVKQAISEEVRL